MPTKPLADSESTGVAPADEALSIYELKLDALGPYSRTVGGLDGLLAAVAVAPGPMPPETWIPHIWLLEEGDPEPDLDFDSTEVTLAVAAILERLQQISLELERGAFEPIYDVDGSVLWETWAEGFEDGMALDIDGWEPRALSTSAIGEATRLLITLIELGRDEREVRDDLGAEAAESLRETAPDLLPDCVQEIARLSQPQTPRVRGPKIGRNDPCPCGSGRKHKKCCGAAQ